MEDLALDITSGALGILVKTTALLAIGFAANLVLRKASAAWRHFVWSFIVVLLLILPLMSLSLPRWYVPRGILQSVNYMAVIKPAGITMVSPRPVDAPAKASDYASKTVDNVTTSEEPESTTAVDHTRPISSFTQITVSKSLLVGVWIFGFIAVIINLVVGLFRIRRISVNAGAFGENINKVELEHYSVGVKRQVDVRFASEHDRIFVPITWGYFRPLILLPSSASAWPPSRTRAAILHEMAHIRRSDWALLIISQVVCAIYWIHPLVWLAVREMRRESERACDDIVLGLGIPPSDYAQMLVDVVRSIPEGRGTELTAVVAMAKPSDTGQRISAVLAKMIRRSPVSLKAAIVAGIFLIACASILAAMQVGSANEQASLAKAASAPSAVTFRIVGVTGQRTSPRVWWDTNGRVLAKPPVTFISPVGAAEPWETNYTIDLLAVRADTDTQFFLDQPSADQPELSYTGNGTPGQMLVDVISGFPKGAAYGDLNLEASIAPWTNLVTIPDGPENSVFHGSSGLIGSYTMSVYPNKKTGVYTVILETNAIAGKRLAVRVQTEGKFGPTNDNAGPSAESGGKCYYSITVFHSGAGQIAMPGILQAALCRRVELSKIPLAPGLQTAAVSISAKTIAQSLVDQGEELQSRGNMRDGIPDFRAAIKADPGNGTAQYQLANALYDYNERSAVRTDSGVMCTVQDFFPTGPSNMNEAISHMEKAVALWPQNAQWHYTLAIYYSASNLHLKSIDQYYEALKLSGSVVPIDMTKGRAPDIENKASIQSGCLSGLGEELIKIGSYKEAVSALDQALKFNWCPEVTYLDLGNALNGCGRRAEAIVMWRRCEAAQPVNDYYANKARKMLSLVGAG